MCMFGYLKTPDIILPLVSSRKLDWTHTFDTHCTFIVLLSYLILVICISVPSTLCGREENIDEKYDPCILCLSPTGF